MAAQVASGAEKDSLDALLPPSTSLADALAIAEASLVGQRVLAAEALAAKPLFPPPLPQA